LDADWIKAAYYFAQDQNVSMLVPFFTNTFASYSLNGTSPTSVPQTLNLLGQRTAVFFMYEGIASGLENGPAGVDGRPSSHYPM